MKVTYCAPSRSFATSCVIIVKEIVAHFAFLGIFSSFLLMVTDGGVILEKSEKSTFAILKFLLFLVKILFSARKTETGI